MSIKCITFDLDDTLWEVGPVIASAEERFYEWLSDNCPRITNRYDRGALGEHRRRFVSERPHERHDLTGLRTRWIAGILDEFAYHDLSAEEVFGVFWRYRNAVELFDDVAPMMDRLRARYRLGVITNGNACVEQIGIDHWFEFVVSSQSAGHAKPAPQIFHSALQHAAVAARDVVHVGDDPANDVCGAAAIGMRTVWFNPQGRPWPETGQSAHAPDATISALSQLHDAVRRIESASG